MKRGRFAPPAVGGCSLLVIFGVLVLTVFALLSVSTARAEARISEASAKTVENYYAADLAAEGIFAQLRAGELPTGVTVEQGLYRFQCPVSENQQLSVELFCSGEDWQVRRWQVVPASLPVQDQTQPLWDGDMP